MGKKSKNQAKITKHGQNANKPKTSLSSNSSLNSGITNIITSNTNINTVKKYPFVSVCTPTFNRRPFIPAMIKNYLRQDYPHDRMEWIIIDDGTDKIEDLVKDISGVKYFAFDKKMSLGKKRNLMHDKSSGDILVYMDDDDYYPSCRVSHSVEKLLNHPEALCAGSSEIYVWFNELGKMYQFGPYGPNHATAGTFAFKKQLLKDHRYDNNAALAEEKAFLKNYTVPFVQLDPVKTILVFSHDHNTFDKRKLLENPHPDYVRVSDKTVDTFIPIESADLKEFYTKDILTILKDYEPGKPDMKPDVIEQTMQIEKRRQEQAQKKAMQSGNSNISVTMTDGTQKMLSNEEVINIIKTQQSNVQELERIVGEKDNECKRLQALNNLLLKRLREATEALQNAQNMQNTVNSEPDLSYEKPSDVTDSEEVKSENITLSIEEKPASETTKQPNTVVSTPAFVEPTDADVIIEELFK